ncbi:MAG TPA: ABC transporter permease [Allosphingosinicella sp.]|jgi:ABC-type transport system involved in multi-copper enzyme maturation permease subunit
MLDALSAELLKLRRHKATWSLVWLYPIGFTLIFLIGIIVGIAGGDAPEQQSLPEWLENTAFAWYVPRNSVGRVMIAAYVAVVFAGEYGWNTWKLIVPHRSRGALIAAKYAAVLILFALAFLATALLSTLGIWTDSVATGDTIPAGVTAGALLGEHGRGALAALPPFAVTVACVSLAAILTRSTIAALVIAIVLISIEQLIFSFGPILSMRFPAIVWPLYHALPGYHLANLFEWIGEAKALSVEFPGGRIVSLGWATSLAVVTAWIVVPAAATFAAFRRQDIN